MTNSTEEKELTSKKYDEYIGEKWKFRKKIHQFDQIYDWFSYLNNFMSLLSNLVVLLYFFDVHYINA